MKRKLTLEDFVGKTLKTKGGDIRYVAMVNPFAQEDSLFRIIIINPKTGYVDWCYRDGNYQTYMNSRNNIIIPKAKRAKK
jgi:hypothetical protein